MLNQDRLGLIADLNYLRPTHQPLTVAVPPQESYVLVPLGQGVCDYCRRNAPVTLVLGVPRLTLCAKCDPATATVMLIESSFAEESENTGWVLA